MSIFVNSFGLVVDSGNIHIFKFHICDDSGYLYSLHNSHNLLAITKELDARACTVKYNSSCLLTRLQLTLTLPKVLKWQGLQRQVSSLLSLIKIKPPK